MCDELKNKTLEELEEMAERQRDYIFCQECGNDFYYTRGSYYEDKAWLGSIEAEIKRRKEGDTKCPNSPEQE